MDTPYGEVLPVVEGADVAWDVEMPVDDDFVAVAQERIGAPLHRWAVPARPIRALCQIRGSSHSARAPRRPRPQAATHPPPFRVPRPLPLAGWLPLRAMQRNRRPGSGRARGAQGRTGLQQGRRWPYPRAGRRNAGAETRRQVRRSPALLPRRALPRLTVRTAPVRSRVPARRAASVTRARRYRGLRQMPAAPRAGPVRSNAWATPSPARSESSALR